MEYYAHYHFSRREDNVKTYVLESKEGDANISFAKFVDNQKNIDLGISGKEYMMFTLPRSRAMRRYFAYVFESEPGKPITSVEGLNGQLRTFGDGKNLGTKDLILFQFSEDMMSLDMFFVKDKAKSVFEKKLNFNTWCTGSKLEAKIS